MSATNRPTWPVLSLITAGMGAGPLLNFGLAATSALVISTFGLSSAQFGFILTVVFTSAAIVSLVLGWLADRISPRAQWVVLFGGAAAALALAGLAPNYGFLLATAVLSGISQAMSNPTTNRAVTALAPPLKRIGWIGVKQSGVQVSQLVAGLAMPALALVFGWSGAALTMSMLCVVLLVLALTLIPDWSRGPSGLSPTGPLQTTASPGPPPAHESDEADRADRAAGANPGAGNDHAASADRAARPAAPAQPAQPAPSPRMVWVIVALLAAISFLSAFGLMSTNGYVALFSVEQFGYPLVVGGLVVALGGLIGVVSRIWWAGQLARGAGAGPLLVVMALGAIAAAACLTASAVWHIDVLIWVGIALHGISVLGANVVVNASVIKVAGKRRLGLATGVTATGMYAGFATGPIVAGALIDTSGGFAAGWASIGVIYVVCLAVSLVFSGVTRHLRPPKRRSAAPQPTR